MNDNSDYQPPPGSIGPILIGVTLMVAAIVLGLMCLPMALDDPCSGVAGCEPLVDLRPYGWAAEVFALVIGSLGVWLVGWGSRPAND